MRVIFFAYIFIFLIFSCNDIINSDATIEEYMPSNSKAIIKINNGSKFKNSFVNNKYLNELADSNNYISEVINILNKNELNNQIVICFYKTDKLMFNIMGQELSIDSTSNSYLFNEKKFSIISNNPKLKRNNPNEEAFSSKFSKIDQVNNNFSIAFDNELSMDLINSFFNESEIIQEGNLYLNIDATNNSIFLNGVVDKYFENRDFNFDQSELEEVRNSEINFQFDQKNDLIEDYDLTNTNLEKSINPLNFEKEDSKTKYFKIFQLKKGNNISNINGVISEIKENINNNSTAIKYETRIQKNITLGPIIVKNHINYSSELIIQDDNDFIYLINNSGQIEWSKKIDGKILKNIQQIDSYKNGKLQYVFATSNKLYMLDRKGRDVGKFPLKFNDNITQPISIFDYDRNKNYRILITQNKELFMFDSRGKRVRGFNYLKNDEIITSPKHFRISNKDIIVFKTEKDLKIINRRGKIRIKLKNKYNFSSDNIFQTKNKLITKTDTNELIEIDLNGNTEILGEYKSDMSFAAFKQLLVIIDGNIILTDKNKSELNFGEYKHLKIYNDKTTNLISLFDSQNNKSYLFDKNLNLIDGFPINSNSEINYKINNGNLEYAFKVDNSTIRFYKKII